MAASSKQDILTREELEAMSYDNLKKMDDYLYSVKTYRRSASAFTRKTKEALINRILKANIS